MTKKEKEAILNMAEELYESAVEKMKDELNWGLGVCEIDLQTIEEETEYIHKLQQLAEQVNNIEEDELEEYAFTDFDLEFLKNDFPFSDLLEMVKDAKEESEEEWEEGEADKIANEICDAIYACAEVKEMLRIAQENA